jgi:hypothetical protein
MDCSRCSQPIESGATFCGNCGQAVPPAQSAETVSDSETSEVLSDPSSPLSPSPATASDPDPDSDRLSPSSEPLPASPAPDDETPALPVYAVANPTQQKNETKAMVGLVLSILGVPGALVPVLGMALGVTGLVLGTTTRATAKKTVSNLSIIFAVIAVLGSTGMYVYSYNKINGQKSSLGNAPTSQSTETGSDSTGSKTAIGTAHLIDTPCYATDFPQLATLDNAFGSCTLKTYDTTSTATATNIYTIDVLSQKNMTEAQFVTTAKDNLSQSLKSNLPGLVVAFEKSTTFANSPAYVINGKYQGNIGVEMMFVYHPTAHGENVFVIVHGINNGAADTSVLAKNWAWK